MFIKLNKFLPNSFKHSFANVPKHGIKRINYNRCSVLCSINVDNSSNALDNYFV